MPGFSAGGRTHNRAGVNRPDHGYPGLRTRHAGVTSILRYVGKGGAKRNVVFKSKKKPTQPTLETFPTDPTPIPSPEPCSSLTPFDCEQNSDRCIWDDTNRLCLSKGADLDDNGMLDAHEKAFHADLSSEAHGLFSAYPALHAHHTHFELLQELLELYKAGHTALCLVISVEGKYSIARHDREMCGCPTQDNPNECFLETRIFTDLEGNPIQHENQQFSPKACKSVTVRGGDQHSMTLHVHPLVKTTMLEDLDNNGMLDADEIAFSENLYSILTGLFLVHPELYAHHSPTQMQQEILAHYKDERKILCMIKSAEGKSHYANNDVENCPCHTEDTPNECLLGSRLFSDLDGNPIIHDNQQLNSTLCKSFTIRGGDRHVMLIHFHVLEWTDMFERLDANNDGVLSRDEVAQNVTQDAFDALDTDGDGGLSKAEMIAAADANEDGVVSGTELSNYDKGFETLKKLLYSVTEQLGMPEFLRTWHQEHLAVELTTALKLHEKARTDTEYSILLNLNCGHTHHSKHGCGKCDSPNLVHTESDTDNSILSTLRTAEHSLNDLDNCKNLTIDIDGKKLTIHLKGEHNFFKNIPEVQHCLNKGDVRCIGKSTEHWGKLDMTTVFTNLETKHNHGNHDAIVTIQVPTNNTECISNTLYLPAKYHPVESNTNGCISAAACLHSSHDLHLNEALDDKTPPLCLEEVLAGIVLYLQVRSDNGSIIHLIFHT